MDNIWLFMNEEKDIAGACRNNLAFLLLSGAWDSAGGRGDASILQKQAWWNILFKDQPARPRQSCSYI